MRDSQKSKVYAMEWEIAPSQMIIKDKREARRFFRHVCTAMQCPELKMKFRRGGVRSYYYATKYENPTICILSATKEDILHEIAHHITRARYGDRVESHGPEFAGIMVAMFVVFLRTDPRTAFKAAEGLVA